jgi:hypothetical protein
LGEKRFRQELDRSGFRGPNARRYVTMAGDKDDRHVCAIAGNALLKLETIEVRQAHVEYQTARAGRSRPREKLLRGSEYFRLPAGVIEEELERLAYRNVVINNENDGCKGCHGARFRTDPTIAVAEPHDTRHIWQD